MQNKKMKLTKKINFHWFSSKITKEKGLPSGNGYPFCKLKPDRRNGRSASEKFFTLRQ